MTGQTAYSRDTDLTGLWSGEYWYDGASFPTPFTAHILDSAGTITGTTLEPNVFARANQQAELSATIDGARGALSVRFTKVYDPAPGVHTQPVFYSGSVDPKFTIIDGDWRFGGPNTMTGRFVLVRVSRGTVAEAETTAAEQVIRK